MSTKYTKAEIQFWWDPNDNAIHVTTRPGSTSQPLHTTFPNNEDSVRWHRSFFTWLMETLKAEGKPVPAMQANSTAYAKVPIRLRGRMWWNDAAKPGRLEEFVLREDVLAFAVVDMEDREPYRGTLQRHETERSRFEGRYDSAAELEGHHASLRTVRTAHTNSRENGVSQRVQRYSTGMPNWNAMTNREPGSGHPFSELASEGPTVGGDLVCSCGSGACTREIAGRECRAVAGRCVGA